MKMLFNHSREVGEWVRERVPNVPDWGPFEALGIVDGTRIVAGVVYNHFAEANIEMSVAAEEGVRWLSRDALFGFFYYPFVTLKCRRVTSTIKSSPEQKSVRKFCQHVGFKYEGVVREFYRDGRDAVIYGMLRRECRWLDHQERLAA